MSDEVSAPTPICGDGPLLDVGRETCGRLDTAEPREWLCANGIGGFASGTVAGLLTRRYHGLLVAALKPPVGRTLLVAKLDETVECGGAPWELCANRWADGTLGPHGYRLIERFRLDGTTPVWTFACADAQIEKRIWMEPGANTTYVRYALLRGSAPATLALKAVVNYRDFHASTHAGGWRMAVDAIPHGLRVTAYDGARPFVVLAKGIAAAPAHEWYLRYGLAREAERGLDAVDDNLHAGKVRRNFRNAVRATRVIVSSQRNLITSRLHGCKDLLVVRGYDHAVHVVSSKCTFRYPANHGFTGDFY